MNQKNRYRYYSLLMEFKGHKLLKHEPGINFLTSCPFCKVGKNTLRFSIAGKGTCSACEKTATLNEIYEAKIKIPSQSIKGNWATKIPKLAQAHAG